VLDKDSALHFSLLRLQLVELIRSCISVPDADITPALNFATTCLAPRAPSNPEFLEDLERTMALLIFPPDDLAPPLAALLDPSLRKDVAKKVNEALLQSQGESTKAKIYDLVRLRAWSEQKAREAKKDLPERIDLGLDPSKDGHDNDQEGELHNNGESEAMVT
jgi:glucose-induced degradation protein 8